MAESLEELPPANEAEIALAGEMSLMPEESASPVSLEMALSHSDMGASDPVTPQFSSPGQAQESPRNETAMPQGALLKIPVNVQVILGTTRMPLHKVMALGPGSIVALDKELSEPVVLLVNGNEVARGLIVVVNEKTGQLGISLTEVLSNGSGRNSAKPM